MIKSFAYGAEQPGPQFLVLGAVHGNEKCGTIAINRVMAELDAGMLKIVRGSVTFIPICNPRAYEQDVRFMERNLNRYLVPMERPDTYEAELGNALCLLLEKCDVLLDIHSYTVGGAPFFSADAKDTKGKLFAEALGPFTILTGWTEAYARTGRNRTEADKNEAVGTTEYARSHGATSITFECGQHKAPDAPEVAYQAIRAALRYLGMTGEGAAPPVAASNHVSFDHVYYKDDEGRLARDWKNLDPVKAGEPMAFHADGSVIAAPGDGYMIMPKANAQLGEEWFYYGVKVAA